MTTPQELLAASALFAEFPATHRDQLASRLTRHEHPKGADIVRQGDPGDALYIIDTGLVGVSVRDDKTGMARSLNQLGPRESFGEMALLTAAPRSATCTALEPTVVYRLGRDVFEAVATKVPSVGLAVARTLAGRLQRMANDREITWVSLSARVPDKRLLATVSDVLMRQYRAVPIEMNGSVLTLGLVDPQDTSAVQVFKHVFSGSQLRVVAISADEFERFMGSRGGDQGSVARGNDSVSVSADARPSITFIEEDDQRASRAAQAAASGPQVIALVDEIVGTGLAIGASDIHIEHERTGIKVRYRVDGTLRVRAQPIASEMGKPLVSRLKLLAKLDITETRRPQDGRISLSTGRRAVDLRMSTVPAKFGEKVVLRILDAEANIADLKGLLLFEPVRQVFSEMVFRPHGLVLVTGSTGSGKSTTMYSALGARRRPELNVVTVEDPIEYHLDGVTQIQVQPEITSFASVLRALLRQDPNVIMVGETRDRETARMAVEASMTGHMVITSMHTNSAIEAMYRLLDLGVERYAIANAMVGVLHQRLVRRICASCAEPCEYPQPIVERLVRAKVFAAGEVPTLRRGAGCAKCAGTGAKGRVAVTELLVGTDAVKTAFAAGASLADLAPVAEYGGLISLARCAGAFLTMGLTTPGEVLQLVQSVGS